MNLSKIKEFAAKQGFKKLMFHKTWNGYDVYEAYNEPTGFTGVPCLVFVKGDIIRWEENEEIITEFFNSCE